MLKYWSGTAWVPSDKKQWAGQAYQDITVADSFSGKSTGVNYVQGNGSAISLTAAAPTVGQVDMSWTYNNAVGPSTGIVPIRNASGLYLLATDGHAYSNSMSTAPELSGTVAAETTQTSSSWGGLANATTYAAKAHGRNLYRSAYQTSNTVNVTTRTVTQYASIGNGYGVNASWSASYNGSDVIRADAGGYLYHGYYGTNQGVQKSMIGYNIGYVPAGAVVDSAYITLRNATTYYGGGVATLNIYVTSHKGTQVPSSLSGIATQLIWPGVQITDGQVGGWNTPWPWELNDDVAGQNIIWFVIYANSNTLADYGKLYNHVAYGSTLYINYHWGA